MRLCFFLLTVPAAAHGLDITLLDYAGVPQEVLAQAGKFFAGIYEKAGVEVRLTVRTGRWRPGQIVRLEDIPGDIVLRICSREMATRLTPKVTMLGYVQPSLAGKPARVASVFYHRVENVNDITGEPVSHVLGAALAHELGHLLLGKGAHSARGIMRCPWELEDLRQISRGRLDFDKAQARQIRARIGNSGDSAE